MESKDQQKERISLDRIVLIAVATAAFFLSVGAWVLTELTP